MSSETTLTPATIKRGGRYNWKGQPDRLIYLRRFNGWHQFRKIGDSRDVWCEIVDEDLCMLEETPDTQPKEPT
jgi:hypothetical protein